MGMFILPQVTLAAWWNPLSWGIFHRTNTQTQVLENHTVQSKNKIVTATTTAPTSTQPTIIETTSQQKQITTQSKNIKSVSVKSNIFSDVSSKVIIHQATQVNPSNSNDPKTVLISQLLNNPTLESFRTFCNSAKNIQGKRTKQVLDSNRENMITVKLSLYDDFNDCQNLDNLDRGVSYLPLDSNLIVSLANNDTDDMREAKVIFNNKIKDIMATSKLKFIAFKKYPITVQSPTELFQSCVDVHDMQQQINKANEHLNIGVGGIEGQTHVIKNTEDNLKSCLKYTADSVYDISAYFK